MSNVESARGNRWQLYQYKATPDDCVAISSPLTGTCQELKVKRERAAAYKHGICTDPRILTSLRYYILK